MWYHSHYLTLETATWPHTHRHSHESEGSQCEDFPKTWNNFLDPLPHRRSSPHPPSIGRWSWWWWKDLTSPEWRTLDSRHYLCSYFVPPPSPARIRSRPTSGRSSMGESLGSKRLPDWRQKLGIGMRLSDSDCWSSVQFWVQIFLWSGNNLFLLLWGWRMDEERMVGRMRI